MLRSTRLGLLTIGGAVGLAGTAFAQGQIAGTVKDATGALLPGVTVEASSPALIEKVRSTVTDERGQYRLSELRPGVYTVTFSMAGFATLLIGLVFYFVSPRAVTDRTVAGGAAPG